MSKTETADQAVGAKATKEAKARRADGGVEYLHPTTREWVFLAYQDECEAVVDFMAFYGRKQKFADYVYVEKKPNKKGEPGPSPEERFNAFIGAMRSGGFNERTGAATPEEKMEKSFDSLSPEKQLELLVTLQAKVAALKG